MSAKPLPLIPRFDVGSVYLTYSGRRLRVTGVRPSRGGRRIQYIDEAQPSTEHIVDFYTMQQMVESVLS